MAFREWRIDRTTDAQGTAYYIGSVNLGAGVYAMSASVFEHAGSEPAGLGEAFFEVTQFSYRYKRYNGLTDVSIRIAAIQKNPWFTNGTRTPLAQSGLSCSIIVRYANGATLDDKVAEGPALAYIAAEENKRTE